MRIRWFGHSAFEIDAKAGRVLLDPWINNPNSPVKLEEIREASVIVVTHDHSDHVGETVPIAKRTGATVCAIPELAAIFRKEGLKVHAPNMGSLTEVQGIELAFVPAFHTSGTGLPTGAIVKLDEAVIYHMGDTSVFTDMSLIRDLYEPGIAMVPIGEFYTMGPIEAVRALQIVRPGVAIPMHYGTFPVLVKDPSDFVMLAHKSCPEVRVVTLEPGEAYEASGQTEAGSR